MRGETIQFGQYAAVVFRGDLEHAGAAWSRSEHRLNRRIHLYFITGGESCKGHLKCGAFPEVGGCLEKGATSRCAKFVLE